MADLSLDIQVDPQTAAKIREVSAKKEAAVAHEDYDEAKRLKGAIERLRVVGQKVGVVCAGPWHSTHRLGEAGQEAGSWIQAPVGR